MIMVIKSRFNPKNVNTGKYICSIPGTVGAGKTRWYLYYIKKMIKKHPEMIFIIALPTIRVMEQVYGRLDLPEDKKTIIYRDQEPEVSAKTRIEQAIAGSGGGAFIISNKSVFIIDERYLVGTSLIIDESPDSEVCSTILDLEKQSEDGEANRAFEEELRDFEMMVETTESIVNRRYREANAERVVKNPDFRWYDFSNFARKMTALKVETGDIRYEKLAKICYAIRDDQYCYFSSNESGYQCYSSFSTYNLVKVLSCCERVYLAAAELDNNLLKYLLSELHGFVIEDLPECDLPKVHTKKNIYLYPALQGKNASLTLYKEGSDRLKGVDDEGALLEYLYKHMKGRITALDTNPLATLLCVNNDADKIIPGIPKVREEVDGVLRIPVQSHGLFDYQHHSSAIWLAVMNPCEAEKNLLRWVIYEHNESTGSNIEIGEVLNKLWYTRNIGPMLQGLGRTSIRVDGSTDENHFGVPDIRSAVMLKRYHFPNATIVLEGCEVGKTTRQKEKAEDRLVLCMEVAREYEPASKEDRISILSKYRMSRQYYQKLKMENLTLVEAFITERSVLTQKETITLNLLEYCEEHGCSIAAACREFDVVPRTFRRNRDKMDKNGTLPERFRSVFYKGCA